ncbi:uncharacterized protein STEHIDRAFT_65771, partial [Stereum hirsutum FP-91666 SS1]|uniref:uncharacterized protein n=1 Tax=Stereum hirsutum (strain FP-91666) TaxID=721885 RepID=UPI000444983B
VKSPRVLESAFSMECTLYAAHDIPSPATGKVSTTLILGLVKYIHVRKDVLTENKTVDPAKFRAVGRLGDVTYARVGEGFRLARPQWEEEKDKIEQSGGKGSGPSL